MGFIRNADREERKTAACVLLQRVAGNREKREELQAAGGWDTVTNGGGRLEGEDLWDSQEIEARGSEGLLQVF